MGKLFNSRERAAKVASVAAFLWGACAVTAFAAAPSGTDGPSTLAADVRTSDPSADLPVLAAPRPPALHLLWFDPSEALSPSATRVLADEVRDIFRGLGVEVAFRVSDPDANYEEGLVPEVPVILLKDDPIVTRRPTRVLGLVVRHQEPQRAVWAFLENVRWTLSHDQDRILPAMAHDLALGRALGRVVAHEVIHSIAPEEPHSRSGLMGHSMNRAFLLSNDPPLEARCGRAFLAALAARRPQVPAEATAATLTSVR